MKFLRSIAGVSAAVLLVLASVGLVVPVYAGGEGISSADIVDKPGEDIYMPDLQVTGEDNEHISLRIEASGGEFWFDNEDNITVQGNVEEGIFTVSGLREDVNAALATLYFYGDQELYTVELTLVDGNYNPENGHIYQVVEDSGISWANAKTAAEGLTNGGVNGYLATITSQQEHDFVRERISSSGWIGANDTSVEGQWRWVTGPEAGTQLWSGDENGSAFGGAYNNWNDGEPNDGSEGEDCGQIWFSEGSDGQWNDLDCESDQNEYYVVEFGAPGALPEVVLDSFTIDLRGDSSVIQVSSCDQLFALGAESFANTIELVSDIDCQGRTEAPMFDEEDFYGVFEGNGFTIKNLNIATEDGSHVGLTGYSVGATYRNIFLDNIGVTGNYHNGVLAGHVEQSIIAENIHATNITMNGTAGAEYVEEMGVLFGTVDLEHEYGPSRIEHVSVQGTFTINDVEYVSGVGGLAGRIEAEGDLVIKQAYADVNIVTSNIQDYSENVGGLVGYWDVDGESDNADKNVVQGVENSYTWGKITSPSGTYVGGLIGNLANDIEDDADMSFAINNSYSWMDIDSLQNTGGLIGFVEAVESEGGVYEYQITNSFYAGTVSGDTDTGILVGIYEDFEEEFAALVFTNVWYDAAKASEYECVSNVAMDGCNAANSDGTQPNYFIKNKANAPMDEWDFTTIWKTNAGTPPVFKPFAGNDGDQDGANDYIETRAPNNGDGNNDGTPDDEQSNVASFVNPETGKYITLGLSEECGITNASTLKASEADHQDSSYTYANGLVNFSADCGEEGFTAGVTLYHHGVSKSGLTVRKYNPNTGKYFTITNASLADQIIGGQSAAVVSYKVTDGGELDIDGEADGSITDPVGLGAQSANASGVTGGSLSKTGISTVFYGFAAGLLILASLAIIQLNRRVLAKR